MEFLVFVLYFIVCMGAIAFLGTTLEAKGFNKGVCKECNIKLRYFDTDSQGGRGYTCNKCGQTAWVSWPWVDKKQRKETA